MTLLWRQRQSLEAQLRQCRLRPSLTHKQKQQLQILKQTGVSTEVLRRRAARGHIAAGHELYTQAEGGREGLDPTWIGPNKVTETRRRFDYQGAVFCQLGIPELEAGAVVPSEVVEARLHDQLVLWVEACSKRALLASLLLGLIVRDSFTRVTVLADGQELLEEIPAEDADIPDFAERNLYLQLGRGMPLPGIHSQPSAAVEDVLTAYPDLHAELDEIPRYPHDSNTVDDVARSWKLALPRASPSCSSAELGKRWLWLEPGSSLAHTSTSAALGCPWMAVQPGLSVSAAGWCGVCGGRW
ncbi:hypothetical protein QJQ45_016785 [Haematococcus lacustris]|nr:hypothetical protein QJQ45_016785 [Haematococcus lacustris]